VETLNLLPSRHHLSRSDRGTTAPPFSPQIERAHPSFTAARHRSRPSPCCLGSPSYFPWREPPLLDLDEAREGLPFLLEVDQGGRGGGKKPTPPRPPCRGQICDRRLEVRALLGLATRRTRRGRAVASGVRRGLPNRGARLGYVSFVRSSTRLEVVLNQHCPFPLSVMHEVVSPFPVMH
jgi:hypothetical protein